MTDTDSVVTLLCGVAILLGIVGVIVPVMPGLLVCWVAVLVWALLAERGWGKWVVLAIATVIAVAGAVAKYALPGRNLKRTGVPNRSLLAGGVLGLIGFFVVPVIGLLLGFVLGVWLAERVRLGDARLAWPSTKEALKATGLAMLIEMGTGLLIGAVWLTGVVVTG